MHPDDLTRHLPHSRTEFEWARLRPASHHTPIPKAGQRVFYRANDWDTPVMATVLEVGDQEHPGNAGRWENAGAPPFDPNCWRVRASGGVPERDPLGLMVVEPHPDPWPSLLLKIDDQVSHVTTREARLRGSAGWLPLDWEHRERPRPGQILPGRRDTRA